MAVTLSVVRRRFALGYSFNCRSLGTTIVAKRISLFNWIWKDGTGKDEATLERWKEMRSRFKVSHSSAKFINKLPRVEEYEDAVKYSSPTFVAKAEVQVPPLRWKDAYTVGWVQAVYEQDVFSYYPNRTGSWELPELENGSQEALCDSSEPRGPWYYKWVNLRGPSSAQSIHVELDDTPNTTIVWENSGKKLTQLHNKLTFKCWVVLKDERTGKFVALDGYGWQVVMNIGVDCWKPIGSRTAVQAPRSQRQPWRLTDLQIPECAMWEQPLANASNQYVWLGKGGKKKRKKV